MPTKSSLSQERKAGLTFKKTPWAPAHRETKEGKPCGHFNVCTIKRLTKIPHPFVIKTRNRGNILSLIKAPTNPTADVTLYYSRLSPWALRKGRGGGRSSKTEWGHCSVSWFRRRDMSVCVCPSLKDYIPPKVNFTLCKLKHRDKAPEDYKLIKHT